jgi:hypothetical protein
VNNSSGNPFCHNAVSDRSTGIAVGMMVSVLLSSAAQSPPHGLDLECLK